MHWVSDPDDEDAPDLTDTDGDTVPDWVEQNVKVFDEVWQRIVVGLGYRAPASDATSKNPGPDGRTDIYLAELGKIGTYGYCTLDDVREKAAYCVVDNDFKGFPASPADSLRVTAAHEFFHAVQFGYSMAADSWLQEGTAAWVEDEVYDQINDNLQYLPGSALQHPDVPLDLINGDSYTWLYGSWIWWRFLTEYFGDKRCNRPLGRPPGLAAGRRRGGLAAGAAQRHPEPASLVRRRLRRLRRGQPDREEVVRRGGELRTVRGPCRGAAAPSPSESRTPRRCTRGWAT